jgi:two-component system phosphate regulon sensor histidine kinase PhoR
MRSSFRRQVFIGSFAAAAVSLLVLAILLAWQVRSRQETTIERHLTDEARLIASLLEGNTDREVGALDREADRLGQLTSSRITLVAADGRVVGDSTQTEQELATLENHATRPEILAATDDAVGVSRRHSTTINTDMLYVAARTRHPVVRYVRVALPLSDVGAQLAAIRNTALAALAASVPIALLVSWFSSPRRSPVACRTLPAWRNATPAVILRERRTTMAPTSSASWRASSMSRCTSWEESSASCRAIARGWRRFSPAWSKACWWWIRRAGCSW